MAGDGVASVAEAARAKGGDELTRQRSTIGFPYVPLESALELAQAIHGHPGAGICDSDQLAAWTKQSAKSSGYRTQVTAARLFGVIDSPSAGTFKLSTLGRRAMDPAQKRAALADAFLRVPLYKAVFEKYRGGVVPPAAALERYMEGLGVASKMTDRARRNLERSAEHAGFYEGGRERLVRPGVADEVAPPTDEEMRQELPSGGGGGGDSKLHPFIQGLLSALPKPESQWELDQRVKWLQTAANIFDLMYDGDGGIEVRAAPADRSPRPST